MSRRDGFDFLFQNLPSPGIFGGIPPFIPASARAAALPKIEQERIAFFSRATNASQLAGMEIEWQRLMALRAKQSKRSFISFDYDNDEDLKNLLVGQARNPDTPFSISDWSVKEHLFGDWREKVRQRLQNVDLMIVICGCYTNTAAGVADEVRIAQEEQIPYFLLNGRAHYHCTRPATAWNGDKLYSWTWENLKLLIGGAR